MLAGLGSIRIAHKIPLLVIISSLLLALAIGVTTYFQAQTLAHDSNREKLFGVLAAKETALKEYLEGVSADINSLATNKTVTLAQSKLTRTFKKEKGAKLDALRNLYATDAPADERKQVVHAKDKSSYSKTHRSNHAWFLNHLTANGYQDLYLFDKKGNLIYSVLKEADFLHNFKTGPYKDSHLGEIFDKAIAAAKGSQFFMDFAPYTASNDAMAAFIAQPIYRGEDLLGVIAIQLNSSKLDHIMQNVVGLGNTGETYIAGSDGYWRSNSRLSDEIAFMKFKAPEKIVNAISENERGFGTFTNWQGVKVDAVYTPMEFLGTRWASIAEQAETEIEAPIHQMRLLMIGITLILLVIVIAVAVLVSRGITRPLTVMTGSMAKLAEGELNVEIPDRDSQDEIGKMAGALKIFRKNALERHKLREEQEIAANNREARAKKLNELVNEFSLKMRDSVENVSHSASNMNSTASDMANNAQGADQQAKEAANASNSASSNVQTAAAAAEELSASIQEINQRVAHSTTITSQASNEAQSTNDQVNGLVATADRIGEVVDLI